MIYQLFLISSSTFIMWNSLVSIIGQTFSFVLNYTNLLLPFLYFIFSRPVMNSSHANRVIPINNLHLVVNYNWREFLQQLKIQTECIIKVYCWVLTAVIQREGEGKEMEIHSMTSILLDLQSILSKKKHFVQWLLWCHRDLYTLRPPL